jgi:Phage tail sheath protein subtilisin-like domain/Phage tail sheath C-terminal domain
MADSSDWILRAACPVDLSNAGGIFSGSSVEPLKFTDANSYKPTQGDSIYALTNATTPWIVSQAVASVNGSSYRFELFQVATLADGSDTNQTYKIEISNVKLAGTVPGSDWGSFTLSVRDFNDTENRPNYLEIFQNLSLDSNSPNFIARKIGDRYNYITNAGKIIEFGTFANLSKYIRIVMTQNNYPESAVPYGFEAMYVPMGGTVEDNIVHTLKYSKASTSTVSPGKFASGFVFGQTLTADSEIVGLYPTSSAGTFVYENNLQYLAPIPANATIGRNTGFYLDTDYTEGGVGVSNFISSSTGAINAIPAVLTANESTYVKMRKFVLGFQGGFDGQSPAIAINIGSDIIAGNTQGLNCATISSAGSVAYNQCLGALSNADEFDINLIVMPGIFHSLHSYVAQLGIDLCEQRGDCFYIMDNIVFPNSNQSVDMISAAINDVSTIDSNYVGTYYPWVKILDTNLNKIVSVPPSVLMPSIFASSDNASAEWFAPAGLNRGGIPQAVQVLDRLTQQNRDTLYEGRVNPIASFPGQGIVVWGQKTLQVKASALDRINVRRLLIALKKFIASTSKYLVFEQNTSDTRNRFLSVVNPYLEGVQQRSGLYAFKVVCDASNNTSDIIDNNILYGQIYLQPTKTAEKIVLDFNILPTGATFPGA